MLLDTHCHLNHDRFDGDLDAALARARQAGVRGALVVGWDCASSEAAVALAREHADLFAAVGVHPHDSADWTAECAARLRTWAADSRVAAIGEIGLDFYRDLAPRAAQERAFRAQLALSDSVGLPVVIHTRESVPETLAILGEEEFANVRGVLHCWSGTAAEAERAVELGYYLGFGGVLTFKNAADVREVARQAPVERLLVETDAPYLAPVPHRGHRNEPAYVAEVAAALAASRGLETLALIEQTGENARRLFTRLRVASADAAGPGG